MEFLYVSEVKLATHKVDNTYVQVVLKEDHDAEIAELVEMLKEGATIRQQDDYEMHLWQGKVRELLGLRRHKDG